MNFKFKNKKVVIFVVIIILILIIVGLFWWQSKRTVSEVEFVKGYEIKDTPEGTIVENKKEKFTAKVPDGWIAKDYVTSVGLFSPETEFDENGGFLDSVREKGACGIGIEIREYENGEEKVEYLKDFIGMTQRNSIEMEKAGYSVVIIDGKPALKTTIKKDEEIRYIEVEVLINNTVYFFTSGLIISQKCVQEFDNVLETISIDI